MRGPNALALDLGLLREVGKKAYLPILIIPGFMSSGLEVIESNCQESWVGERIWLNLRSLGFHASYLRHAKDEYTARPENVRTSTLKRPSRTILEAADEEDSADCCNESGELDPRGAMLRNAWLHHMALQDDMVSERDGVRVRSISGLGGVDYLTDGSILYFVSYVFGPMIRALKQVGYEDGVNLDAAPYDWRLPPCALETRDAYFTRTMDDIERLYKTNRNAPIVLVCHSMGCKVGHYLLNFAKQARGQQWLDKYVHTYCPIGAPHLGAPKALRSMISGDKMGLETFLSDAEGLVLGRSLGSGPWLTPAELPTTATPCTLMRMDGAIEITLLDSIGTDLFLGKREAGHRPESLKLTVAFSGTSLTTPYKSINERQEVRFDEDFTFRTAADGPREKDNVTIYLCEPGLSIARKSAAPFRTWHHRCRLRFFSPWNANYSEWGRPCNTNPILCWLNYLTFWWLLYPIMFYTIEVSFKIVFGFTYGILWCLITGSCIGADEISKVSGKTSPVALARVPHIRRALLGEESRPESSKYIDLELELISYRDLRRLCGCCFDKRKAILKVRIRWIPPESLAHDPSTCRHIVCQPTPQSQAMKGLLSAKKKHRHNYSARSGYDILRAEGLLNVFDHMDNMYAKDPLDPRGLSSVNPPPVSNIKAIYGVNLPTEIGCIYKRHRAALGQKNRVRNLFTPDLQVTLKDNSDGLVVKNGCLWETNSTGMLSGDGTVPYWSLSHFRTWEKDCQVTVDELEGAEHREILADKRLHDLLIDYCGAKYSVPDRV
jgi:Lecithin:cholesterol acyltransferase